MSKFIYKLINSDSIIQKGTIYASSPREAALMLSPNYILSIKKPVSIPKLKKKTKNFWISFFYNLSTLLYSNINLGSAIDCMVREEKDEYYLKILSEINSSILNGKSLSESLSPYKDIPYYYYIIPLIKQSEKGEYLVDTFKEINEYINAKQKLKSDLKNALLHPAMLSIVSLSFLTIVNFYIFPQFELIFKQFGYDLPLGVNLIIIFNKLAILTLILILLLAIALCLNPKYFHLIQKLTLRVPIIKKNTTKFNLTSFFKSLSYLLNHGLPLTQALSIIYTSTPPSNFRGKIKQINSSIQDGERLSKAILCLEGLSSFQVHSIAVSEQSTNLPQNLKHLSVILEDELKQSLNHYIKLLEPIIIIIIGIWMGITICLLFFPLFKCMQDISFGGL